MKILIVDGLDRTAVEILRKGNDVDVRDLDGKGLLAAIPEYHALVVRSRTKVTKEVLGRATRLKVVGRAGVGVDNIDVDEATARKIVVVNAPTASTVSVAELAIGPETRGLVSASELAMMRPNAILVNCARGEIVDERALAEALRARKISGAAIDVLATEPPSESPLLEAPNVVFTPHLGASTAEGQSRAGAIVADRMMKVLAGKRPDFVVNPKVYG